MTTASDSLKQPRLSLCMIVKDEKDNLPRCLNSVKPYVDEMIIVDTGSEDRTPEIAASYGAKVSYFAWCDDFAAARNYAISQVSGDWILMLDADEELVVESESFFQELAIPSKIIAYHLVYTEVNDYLKKTPTYRISLFRNLPGLRYINRLHEYLIDVNQSLNVDNVSNTNAIKIVHYGHFREQVKQKIINRNLPLLERMRQEDKLSFRLLHCLACMYAETGQIEKANASYNEAFEELLPYLMKGTMPEDFDFVPTLSYDLGMQFFNQNNYDTANLLCTQALKWCPSFPPLNYLAGILLNTLGFPLGAAAYFKKCIQLGQEDNYYKGEPFDLIFITTYPAYNIGLMHLQLQQPQEALEAFQLALSFDENFKPALEKIEALNNP